VLNTSVPLNRIFSFSSLKAQRIRQGTSQPAFATASTVAKPLAGQNGAASPCSPLAVHLKVRVAKRAHIAIAAQEFARYEKSGQAGTF
jgi:hypothetical protein